MFAYLLAASVSLTRPSNELLIQGIRLQLQHFLVEAFAAKRKADLDKTIQEAEDAYADALASISQTFKESGRFLAKGYS